MNEIIICPSCQKKLQLPQDYLGKTVQCPGCKTTFTAQLTGSEPPPFPPPIQEAPPTSVREEEEPRPRRRRADDNYDDEYDDYDEYEDRPLRRHRRDLVPHRGGTILALAIVSWVTGCFPLGIAAWVMGNNDLAEIRAGHMDPSGEGTTQAGRIIGMVQVIAVAALVVIFCMAFVFTGLMANRRF